MKRIAFVLTLLVLLGFACGKNRVEKLTERAESFNRSLRWSSLTAASTLVAEETRRTIVQELIKRLRGSRIVDYGIVDLGVNKEEAKASVIVEYSYYTVAHQELKYRQELQLWHYDSKKKNWFIVGIRTIPTTQ